MSIDAHILKPLDFFMNFSTHELEECAAAFKSKTVEAGEVLEISSRGFFELIQGDNALGEKIMKKIDKIASERRTIAAGSQ